VEKHGTARQATDDNIIRRMRIACCITKATDTLRIFKTYLFSTKKKWLRERVLILRYIYITRIFLPEFHRNEKRSCYKLSPFHTHTHA
jgi:hypothetical protein